ncbi:B3/B4 domain-containing protein [Olsenella intestinalis]|uniref:B3/B4 domain-containing protein n=1 Tax=Olsenella intestinalis TaxID=2930083 RepID=UPI00200D6608|nr:phenylalanine--tRNA ligase beta subunit-related protein [Olsenella intestinalis]
MKKFVVEDSFWELFPEVEIGVLCVDGILPTDQISEESARAAEAFLNRANANAEKWLTSTTISQNEVVAVWRKAYQQFKTKKGARCSVENLLKRVLKENPVGHIVPSVDVSNAISLKYALPIGAENIDAIEGTFRLAKTEGGDYFLPIGEEESDPTLPGEVAYLDDAGAVCRCWNWRDGQRTEVSDETPHCMFIMENVMPERSEDLHAAIDELAEKCEQLLGATVTNKDYATREHPEIDLV